LANRNYLLTHVYQTINIVLASCIILIFIYSAVFSPDRSRHPIPSVHTLITGEPTASTGLSRGFSAIMRFRFDEARNYNIYSIRIFLFFLIQFFVRIVILLSGQIVAEMGQSRFVMLDALASGALFIFCFEPFLRDLLRF
jgi:hypothetical protein